MVTTQITSANDLLTCLHVNKYAGWKNILSRFFISQMSTEYFLSGKKNPEETYIYADAWGKEY